MPRYLMTHSLLSAWQYSMEENPYEDATNETDPMGDFLKVLRREPREPTEAMQNGIDFEDMVTSIANGAEWQTDKEHRWYNAAAKVADIVRGGSFQFKARKQIEVAGTPILLYGILDVLKAGTIYDVKFSKSYDRGKYIDSTQHPTYFELVPEAFAFKYLVSNGSSLWTETYRRDETPSIIPVAADFLGWLEAVDLMDVYRKNWVAL